MNLVLAVPEKNINSATGNCINGLLSDKQTRLILAAWAEYNL